MTVYMNFSGSMTLDRRFERAIALAKRYSGEVIPVRFELEQPIALIDLDRDHFWGPFTQAALASVAEPSILITDEDDPPFVYPAALRVMLVPDTHQDCPAQLWDNLSRDEIAHRVISIVSHPVSAKDDAFLAWITTRPDFELIQARIKELS